MGGRRVCCPGPGEARPASTRQPEAAGAWSQAGLVSLCTRSSACDPGLVWKLCVDIFSFVHWGAGRHPLCLATVWIKCHQNWKVLSVGLALVNTQDVAVVHLGDFALWFCWFPWSLVVQRPCLFFPQPVSFLFSSIPSWLECASSKLRLRNPSGCDCLQLGWWGGPSLHLHHLLSSLLQQISPPPRSLHSVPLPLLVEGIRAAPGRLWSLCSALLSSKAVPPPFGLRALHLEHTAQPTRACL